MCGCEHRQVSLYRPMKANLRDGFPLAFVSDLQTPREIVVIHKGKIEYPLARRGRHLTFFAAPSGPGSASRLSRGRHKWRESTADLLTQAGVEN